MKKLIHFLPLCIAVLSFTGLTSCKTNYLLKEDFSADVIGSPPAKDIVGSPTGDMIRYSNALIPRLAVQASTVTAGAKALVLSEAPITATSAADGYLSCDGPAADLSKSTRFEWTAKHRKSTGTLLIDAYGPQLLWITRLYLRPDGQLIRIVDVAKGIDDPKNELLCRLDITKPHTVFITLNREEPKTIKATGHTYSISVFNDAQGNMFSRQGLPVLFEPDLKSGVGNDGKMTLTFGYKPESTNADYAYVFERINIVQL